MISAEHARQIMERVGSYIELDMIINEAIQEAARLHKQQIDITIPSYHNNNVPRLSHELNKRGYHESLAYDSKKNRYTITINW